MLLRVKVKCKKRGSEDNKNSEARYVRELLGKNGKLDGHRRKLDVAGLPYYI